VSRPEVDEPVEIVAPDPRWPAEFGAEAARLREALGADAALEHIGSTAVPGLAAKPIVDVMLGVDSLAESQAVVDRVLALGYVDRGGAPGRRYLVRRGERNVNVQVVERHGQLWRDNLLLRDFLRASLAAARRYEAAKRAAAESSPFLLGYSEAKRAALEALLDEARRGV
jgi:GrpB-like predicted nucleotidyltransferase (UPF0157 family)